MACETVTSRSKQACSEREITWDSMEINRVKLVQRWRMISDNTKWHMDYIYIIYGETTVLYDKATINLHSINIILHNELSKIIPSLITSENDAHRVTCFFIQILFRSILVWTGHFVEFLTDWERILCIHVNHM